MSDEDWKARAEKAEAACRQVWREVMQAISVDRPRSLGDAILEIGDLVRPWKPKP